MGSTYNQLIIQHQQDMNYTTTFSAHYWLELWHMNIPYTLQFFMGKLSHYILPVASVMYKYSPQKSQMCAMCGNEVETTIHLLLKCSFARDVWFATSEYLWHHLIPVNNLQEWFSSWTQQQNPVSFQADHLSNLVVVYMESSLLLSVPGH